MKLIDEWKTAWRLASVQLFAVVAVLPDIYNGIAAFGWLDELPGPAKWILRGLGAAGIIARVIKQGERDGDRQHP